MYLWQFYVFFCGLHCHVQFWITNLISYYFFSGSATFLLHHVLSLNDLIHSQDFNTLWMQITLSVRAPTLSLVPDSHFRLLPSCQLSLLPHSDLKLPMFKTDLSIPSETSKFVFLISASSFRSPPALCQCYCCLLMVQDNLKVVLDPLLFPHPTSDPSAWPVSLASRISQILPSLYIPNPATLLSQLDDCPCLLASLPASTLAFF